MKELVSTIVTTKNSSNTLWELLLSLKHQTYKLIEIVIIDNHSTDQTLAIAKRYINNIYTKGPERSAQRNFGVQKSTGKYVLILDSDMQLTKDVIKECVNKMKQDTKLGALIIPEKSIGYGFWAKCKAFEREFYVGEESIEAARFFRKKIFQKFGGYDQRITGPEDWDLPLRMKKSGVKIGRVSKFIFHDEGEFSIWRSARKKYYYALSSFQYLKKHPEMITSQGNMILRPVFIKKWRKILSNPALSIGMIVMKSVEMTAVSLGLLSYLIVSFKKELARL